mmetsp:Transcript_7841/g.5883  ORF Transcript_7841/g.5883 Transcript_7841/m.5883 type:complete len:232 (-) Transcript_7841:38-733(-)|eukprot:CAMPEP_0202957810 /NCGR_PEP_ID=MMETSP1396-20130829/2203_1 /ASSEMBLY_ACC=CAM_ASM_000872 /TAXON_ID= /ORGANISM="Pseudokeronopsis sp., Strain Brazil" /LENGTH=231 /DNA_ID=CAMNT_0049675511 /DNA_START=89 /DNA_END=784 /DNA_ORIENTATION=+
MRKAAHIFGRALRETGQALDRGGLVVMDHDIYKETFSRHRTLVNLMDKAPRVAEGSFVAPNASIAGDVTISPQASIWYGAVVRGDRNSVKIGARTNVQDRAVINTVPYSNEERSINCIIDDNITIGHGAVLTSCYVAPNTLIGQGAIVQHGAEIGSNVIIAAGAVVLPFTVIPSKQLWAGIPAKYVRDVTDEEVAEIKKSADSYVNLSEEHSKEFGTFSVANVTAEEIQHS